MSKSTIVLKFKGKLFFKIVEEDGSTHRVKVPEELVKEMLNDWNNKFWHRALARDIPPKKKRKTTR